MPEDIGILQKNVAIALAQGKLEEARQGLALLLAAAPTDPVALVLGGDVNSRSGQAQQAYRSYGQAADLFQKYGAWDKVLAVQQRMIKLDPAALDDAAANRIKLLVYVVDAELKLKEGDTPGAVAGYLGAIKAFPNHTLAYQRLASLYLQLGRVSEAMEQYLVVGRAFLSHRLFGKAKPYFQRVLDLDANHEEAQGVMAEILNEEGHPGEAVRYFIVAAEHALQKGQLERAAGFIVKVKNLGAEEALYLEGILFAKQGRKEEAKQALAQFIKTAKQYSKALTQLGELFEAEGRFDLALKCYERAAQDPQALKAKKKAEDIGKKLAAVAAVLRPAPAPGAAPRPGLADPLNIIPGAPLAVPLSAEPAPEDDGPAAALSLIAKPVAAEDVGVLTTMGEMCLAEEMFGEAKQVFERLLRVDPGNENYFSKLNQAREALGLALLKMPAKPAGGFAAPLAQAVKATEESPGISAALPKPEAEPAKAEISLAPVKAKIKTPAPAAPAMAVPVPLPPPPLPAPSARKVEEPEKAVPLAVIPPRHSTLPKDPLDFLLQMEGRQAEGGAEVQAPGFVAAPLAAAAAAKAFGNKKEIASVVKKALAGKLNAAEKVKITRTQLEYQVGELPPSFKSQAVLDDDVIE